MNSRRLAILIALAALVAGAAFWRGHPRAPLHDGAVGTAVLPGLASQLDAVSRIRIVGAGNAPLVTLERSQDRWQVRESAYAADAPRVRRLLVALGDLHVVEAKTADPAHYAALGVEDPAAPGAHSIRLELEGLAAPTALILGRTAGTQGSFVRQPGAAQSFEVRPGMDVARAPREWLARGFLDLSAARVAAVRVERGGEPAWAATRNVRAAVHFDVPNLPHGAELTNAGAADSAASAFGNLEFDEVRATTPPADGEKLNRTVVECYDGLVVTVTATGGGAPGSAHWLSVAARFDPAIAARFQAGAPADAPNAALVGKEAAAITATTAGHEYRLPAYRFDAIFRPRHELLRH